jgi:hypothetical protein
MLNALFTAVLEVLARILFDVVFATLVRGPGFVIVKVVTRSEKVDPDGIAAFIAGVAFWGVLAAGGWWLYRTYAW